MAGQRGYFGHRFRGQRQGGPRTGRNRINIDNLVRVWTSTPDELPYKIPYLFEDFDTGVNGNAVPLTTAFFNGTGNTNGTGTITYDNSTTPDFGTLVCKIDVTTSSSFSRVALLPFTSTEIFLGMWVRISTIPSTTAAVMSIRFGAANLAQVTISNTGVFRIRNNVTGVGDSVGAVSTNTWYFLSWQVDSTTQTQTLRIYGANYTLLETVGPGTFNQAMPWDSAAYGMVSAPGLATTLWIDDPQINYDMFPTPDSAFTGTETGTGTDGGPIISISASENSTSTDVVANKTMSGIAETATGTDVAGATSAITRVNSSSISALLTVAGTPFSTTLGVAAQAGDMLVVMGAGQGTHVANGMSVRDSVNNVDFTTVLEVQQGSASSHWGQLFYYVTPVALSSGTTITFTPYATAPTGAMVVDIFRGAQNVIDHVSAASSNASSASPPGPALSATAIPDGLVVTAIAMSAGTPTAGTPFTLGSNNAGSGQGAALAYVLDAIASTYSSTWGLSAANTSGTITVSFPAITQVVTASDTDPDTASSTDAFSDLTVDVVASETSTGTDAFNALDQTGGTTNISDSDTSSSAEAGTTAVALSATETSAETDNTSATSVSTSSTETSTGTDVSSAQSRTAVETSTGTDAVTVLAVTTSAAETSTSSDVVTTSTRAGTTTETGTGTEAVTTTTVQTSATETSSAADTVGALDAGATPISATETSTSTDATSALTVQVPAAETSNGVETVTNKTMTAPETGTGTDTSGQTTLSSFDSGTSTDAVSAKTMTAAETGSGTEAVTGQALVGAETSTSSDLVTAKTMTAAETGTSTENFTNRTLAQAETATGLDALSVLDQGATNKSATETSTSVDAVSASAASVPAAEGAIGTEATTTSVVTTGSDSSASSDASAITVAVSSSETGVATEANPARGLGAGDSSTTTEATALLLSAAEVLSSADAVLTKAFNDAELFHGLDQEFIDAALADVDTAASLEVGSKTDTSNFRDITLTMTLSKNSWEAHLGAQGWEMHTMAGWTAQLPD